MAVLIPSSLGALSSAAPRPKPEATGGPRRHGVDAGHGFDVDRDDGPLPRALSGDQGWLDSPRAGRLCWYEDGPARSTDAPPLLLIHSVSAASSAFDMRPLYDHFRATRRVYAVDLPGFGLSQRGHRRYTARLMTDAVLSMVGHIQRAQGADSVDAIALSLSCEFLARAAVERSTALRHLTFVSPTGFERRDLHYGLPGSHFGRGWMLALLARHGLGRILYGFLTQRRVIRYFLSRAWGGRRVDDALVEYDYLTSRVPGARFAPLYFLCGFLFSGDSGRLYRQLRQPVWAVHGVRGAFANVPGLASLADRPNWRIEAFPTGAMPHFEAPELFFERYAANAGSSGSSVKSGTRLIRLFGIRS